MQSLYTWLGPALQSFLSELKPVQVKELTEGFEALDKEGKGQGTATQERYTRAQAREREEAELNGNAGEVEEAEGPFPASPIIHVESDNAFIRGGNARSAVTR